MTLIGTFPLPALAPGESVTRTWSFCRTGTMTAITDRAEVVAESDERNNTAVLRNVC